MALDFTSFFGGFSSLPTLVNPPPTLPLGSASAASANRSSIPSLIPAAGYTLSSFMIIAQKMAKQLGIKQSILMDFSYLETDKNFSKPAVAPALNKGAGQVAGATQMNSLVKSQLAISNTLPYIPVNVQNQLFNYQTLLKTNTNFLPVYQQSTTQSNMTAAVGKDLNGQYALGNITMPQLLSIISSIESIFQNGPTAINGAIQNVLGIALGTFLPTSIVTSLTSLLFTDAIANSVTDPTLVVPITAAIATFLTNQAASPLSTFVQPATYTNVPLTLADPFGIDIAAQLSAELVTNFSVVLLPMITAQAVTNPQNLHDIIMADLTVNVSNGSGAAMPKIVSTLAMIDTEINNGFGNAMRTTLDSVVVNIFNDLGVVAPVSATTSTTVSSVPAIAKIDLLFNLHRNIQTRTAILTSGGSISQIATLDDQITTYFATGTYNPAALALLTTKLENFIGS